MVVDYTGQVSVGSNVSNEDLLHKQTKRFQVTFTLLAQMFLNNPFNAMNEISRDLVVHTTYFVYDCNGQKEWQLE